MFEVYGSSEGKPVEKNFLI